MLQVLLMIIYIKAWNHGLNYCSSRSWSHKVWEVNQMLIDTILEDVKYPVTYLWGDRAAPGSIPGIGDGQVTTCHPNTADTLWYWLITWYRCTTCYGCRASRTSLSLFWYFWAPYLVQFVQYNAMVYNKLYNRKRKKNYQLMRFLPRCDWWVSWLPQAGWVGGALPLHCTGAGVGALLLNHPTTSCTCRGLMATSLPIGCGEWCPGFLEECAFISRCSTLYTHCSGVVVCCIHNRHCNPPYNHL